MKKKARQPVEETKPAKFMKVYDLSYADKVFNLLYTLPEGSRYELARHVRPENRELFTDLVKYFIRNDLGNEKAFFIEFTNDYNAIRKISTKWVKGS
jgi:hypothetical protein